MSLHALVNGLVRQPLERGEMGECTYCYEPMRGKVGSIVIPHWAHLVAEGCDPWAGGESEWHLDWKETLADYGCRIEKTMERWGDRHRADAVNPHGVVIELQHGYLSPETIIAREQFYGKMVWVYDARKWWTDERLVLGRQLPDSRGRGFRFRNGGKSLAEHKRDLYFDIGSELVRVQLSLVPHDYGHRLVGKMWMGQTIEQLVTLGQRRSGLGGAVLHRSLERSGV